jgi:hypothetical protein
MSFELESKNVFKDCWVEDTNGDKVGGEKNFDVGFYCDCECPSEHLVVALATVRYDVELSKKLNLKEFLVFLSFY